MQIAATMTAEKVRELNEEFESKSLDEILSWCWSTFGLRAGIGTSFQGAGLVIMHRAQAMGCPFPVFTLDTELLFPETLELKAALENKLGITIEAVKAELSVAQQEKEHGPELWNRHPDLCCTLRKVLPLQGKLQQLDVWITGLRRQQSSDRKKTGILESYKFDVLRGRNIFKLNPLANWSREQVWDYIREHKLPYNSLTDKGYRSIGCWPCTRPTDSGENERAGRWTGFDKAECGIHTFLAENI